MKKFYKFSADCNFFDKYFYQDEKGREKFRSAIIQKRLEFIPNTELIGELLGLFSTKSQWRLHVHANLFLFMMKEKMFNHWNRIVRFELGFLKNEGVYVASDTINKVRYTMEGLSRGKIPAEINKAQDFVSKEKDSGFQSFQKNKKFHLSQLKKLGIKTPKISFNEFYNADYAVKMREDLLRDIFLRERKSITQMEAQEILRNENRYPYFIHHLKVSLAMFYRFNVALRAVKKGDAYDQNQLDYLGGLDFLISEDKGMTEIAQDVFGTPDKIIKFEDLLNIL